MTTVLVIDDIPSVRRSVEVALERAGMTVRSVAGFDDARSVLQTERFDLVLTDILMPEKDGLEVIDEVRRLAPNSKIVAMSGGGSLVSSQEALSVAASLADATIQKPFDREELLAVITPVLGG